MLSRALSLAAVTLLIGALPPVPGLAQAQNLEAGKSPSQIFAGTCTACHKGPRGLLRTVPANSLPGFLRQHYTTSPEMASLLAGFLVANGVADTRQSGAQPKPGKDEKSETRLGGAPDQLDRFGRRLRRAPSQEAANPEPDPRAPRPEAELSSEAGRQGRNLRRMVRPGEVPPAEVQDPAQASDERGPDGRRLSAKQKLSKRGKPGSEETPKTDTPNAEAGKQEPPKSEAAQSDSPNIETPTNETAANGGRKPEGTKPPANEDNQPAKADAPDNTANAEPAAARAGPVLPAIPPTVSAVSTETSSAQQPSPQAVAASALPPVAPAGPPAPPISR